MKLKIKKVHVDAKVPTRAHHDDAGIDMYACGDVTIMPGETVKIATGVAFEMPVGYVGLIWDKSSVGSQGIKTLGGVLDAGYRGEVFVVVHNLSSEAKTFTSGQKVAQMLVQQVELCEIEEVTELEDSLRGEGGFGSTGK
jgi:dUTP pyrophosphatase